MSTNLDLGGIATKKTASSKKAYPTFNGVAKTVTALLAKDKELKAIEGECDRLKKEIAEAVLPTAIAHVKDGGVELGVSATGDGGSALVIYKDSFRSGADLGKVTEIIGKPATDKLFRQRVSLSVSGDVLVETLGDKAQKFIGELATLFKKHGVTEALESKVDFVPTGVKELFTALTVKQVEALNEVYKVPSSVSVKR